MLETTSEATKKAEFNQFKGEGFVLTSKQKMLITILKRRISCVEPTLWRTVYSSEQAKMLDTLAKQRRSWVEPILKENGSFNRKKLLDILAKRQISWV